MQDILPEDPFSDVGSQYLRLSNECPPLGVVVQFTGPPTVEDSNFSDDDGNMKKEYHWPVIEFKPEPYNRTITESSVGFRSALKAASNGSPYGKVYQVRWILKRGKGRQFKEWSIRQVDEKMVQDIFFPGAGPSH